MQNAEQEVMASFRPEENYKRRRWAFRAGEVRLVNEARAAMVEFLAGYPWEWYVTLTFKGLPSLGQCFRAWGELMYELRARNGSPRYFRAVELQSRGVPHFHALMYGVNDSMLRVDAKEWWFKRHGIARVLPYDSSTPALRGYVSKYVVKDSGRAGDWAIELGPIEQQRIDYPTPAAARACVAPAAGPRRFTLSPNG